MKYILLTLLGLALCLHSPSWAEDTKETEEIQEESEEPKEKEEEEENPGLYAPEFCDFEVVFPEEPFISRKCPPGESRNSDKCFDKVTYTMVYD
ncbi:MAG: hypothetical protein MRY79_05160, partial [Alphaproteobacteria bacterium]|nr:hypothetical protein [Alphaproteobacteria bacterium]